METGSPLMSPTSHDNTASYELLLHGLSHEQSKLNYDRHILVLEKWCRESSNGYI